MTKLASSQIIVVIDVGERFFDVAARVGRALQRRQRAESKPGAFRAAAFEDQFANNLRFGLAFFLGKPGPSVVEFFFGHYVQRHRSTLYITFYITGNQLSSPSSTSPRRPSSFIFNCRPLRLIFSTLAAWVTFPSVPSSAFTIKSRSSSLVACLTISFIDAS